MKTYLLAAMAVAIMSGSAMALPAKKSYVYKPAFGYSKTHYGKITPYERAAIARSQFRLNVLKRRIYADGRVTRFERIQLRFAQSRHNALVARARRS